MHKRVLLFLVFAPLLASCGSDRYQIVAEQGYVYRLDTRTGEVIAANGPALNAGESAIAIPAGKAQYASRPNP